jgi:predicted TIM-barrel fold metal-dependent hydrolase
MKVDAHIHLWDHRHTPQPWITEHHAIVLGKVSRLDTAPSSAVWGAADPRPSVEIALDCFGPHRLMCGSDWPVALLNGDYDQVWQVTSEVPAAAAPDASSLLLGGNAARIYRLEPMLADMMSVPGPTEVVWLYR